MSSPTKGDQEMNCDSSEPPLSHSGSTSGHKSEQEVASMLTRSSPAVSPEPGAATNLETEEDNIQSLQLLPHLPEEVVEHILRFVSISEAASLRLVSKEWNCAAIAIINRREMIEIRSVDCVTKFYDTYVNSIVGLSLKVRSLGFCGMFFEDIMRRIRNGEGGLVLLSAALQKLAQISREHVKTLFIGLIRNLSSFLEVTLTRKEIHAIICQIVFAHFTNVEDLEIYFAFNGENGHIFAVAEEEYDLPEVSLPKLKLLTINYSTELQRPELGAFVSFTKSLLKSAKNLKTLRCVNHYSYRVLDDLSLISPQLQVLRFERHEADAPQIYDSEMQPMASHHFPQLQSVQINQIVWSNSNDEIFSNFLAKYSTSLKEIGVVFSSNGSIDENATFPPNGVILKKMEYLCLFHYKGAILWENMPNLVRLNFVNVEVTGGKSYPSVLPSDWPLTEFMYQMETHRFNLETIYPSLASPKFPFWFSKLSKLAFYLKGQNEFVSILPQIFEHCRQLKSLSVVDENGTCMDECISGMSSEVRGVLKGNCPVYNGNVEAYLPPLASRMQIEKMIEISSAMESVALNIGMLSDLQELLIYGSFSDVAVLFGIIYCKKLKKLNLKSLWLSENTEIIVRCGLPDLTELNLDSRAHH